MLLLVFTKLGADEAKRQRGFSAGQRDANPFHFPMVNVTHAICSKSDIWIELDKPPFQGRVFQWLHRKQMSKPPCGADAQFSRE
jgi:hypothetical protein